jgi:AcrR family transcriptional regulator
MAVGARAARAAAKRAQILDGAQTLFLTNGYAATATDAVAAAAGVSKQTLYAYFPSKEDLLAGVLRRLIDPEAPDGVVISWTAHDAPADRAALRRVLLGLAERLLATVMQPAYLALLRVIIAEAPRQPQLAALFTATAPERGFRAVAALMTDAHARGLVAAPDAEAAARLFFGPLLTYALLDGLFVVDGPPRPPAPARVEALVDLFLRAVS